MCGWARAVVTMNGMDYDYAKLRSHSHFIQLFIQPTSPFPRIKAYCGFVKREDIHNDHSAIEKNDAAAGGGIGFDD